MTVGELVSKLAHYPPDTKVVMGDERGPHYEPRTVYVAPEIRNGYTLNIYHAGERYGYTEDDSDREYEHSPCILLAPVGRYE